MLKKKNSLKDPVGANISLTRYIKAGKNALSARKIWISSGVSLKPTGMVFINIDAQIAW